MADGAGLLAKAVNTRQAGRYVEALRLYRAAATAAPGDPTILYQYGSLLTQIGRAEDGAPLLERALALSDGSATVRHALALTLLAAGDYAGGWPLYRRRYEAPDLWQGKAPGLPFPRWHGEDLAGKRFAILPEAGIGDQIQFARFAPELERRGAEVTLLAHPALARLFELSFPTLSVVAASGAVDIPDPDFWTFSSDIAGDLGITIDAVSGAPYLSAPAANRADGPRIGLKLKGDPKFTHDALRSLSDADAAALGARLPGTHVSLDPADTSARDFADTAAIMMGLDAVVVVDTSVAHLAGALGIPTFVLIPGFAADWRWGERTATSPWYDSVRLYRGDLQGHWAGAIRALSRDVRGLIDA